MDNTSPPWDQVWTAPPPPSGTRSGQHPPPPGTRSGQHLPPLLGPGLDNTSPPPPGTMHGRAVRILLECILVY